MNLCKEEMTYTLGTNVISIITRQRGALWVCFYTLCTLPVPFCTSSQANTLWRRVPVSADTISADK